MAWLPSATVTVNGVTYTSKTLAGVTIDYGRNNVWEQPRAGYARVNILNTTDVNNGFEVNQSIVIKIKNSSGTLVTIFTGLVNDITAKIGNRGSAGETTIQTLTAISTFAKMARTTIGGSSYPAETDADRMNRIFTEAGVTATVDTPAIYDFASRAADLGDAYTIAATYATQCDGYIYEKTDGTVGFANESHRLNDMQTNGYYNIPENNILWNGVQSQRTSNDILNRLTLAYASGEVTSENAISQSLFGIAAGKIDTEINSNLQAQIISDRYIDLKSIPQTNLSAFTVQVDSPNLTNTTIDKMVNMYMGFPLQVQNLPLPIMGIIYKGFVEGWTWNIGRVQASITLRTTDSSFSIVPTRWQDVDPTTAWNAVGAAVQWYAYE